jgi:two-component system CheB/CheR fusion protein
MTADPLPLNKLSESVGPDGTIPRLVIGIGASAGGLEALERLFESTPTETGLAFVVVQHLSPDFKSLTDDILARRTRLPIRVVEDGMPVRANAIYLIPPRKDMIVRGGRLLLTDKDPGQTVTLPIDHFLRSLAQEAGERAVAVILSGTGSDGSRGIRDVRAAGGMVVAQDPESAKFDGMPRSAIDTGMVDLVLPPEAIPDALLRRARSPQDREAPTTPTGIEAVFRLLRNGFGIDFSHYKPETVARRLDRRQALNEAPDIDEYATRLAADPAELDRLYKDLMIGVTRFFRDEEAFARLGREVLPGLIGRLPPGAEFRAWVAGCATGEEAYSLAILVRECMDELGHVGPVKIFATDAHRASVDVASGGIYPEVTCAGIGPERLARFFTPSSGGYQVTPDLRKSVVFAQHNVLKDAPFTRLDLVTCRNLLIYFRSAAQKRVLSLFHFALKAGGVMFLGPSETPGEVSDEFEPVDTHWKIYRKRRDVRLVPDLRMTAAVAAPRPIAGGSVAGPDPQLIGAYDALLDEFMPPAFLVNDRGEVVQTFGGAGRYLTFRDGRTTANLLDLVSPDLRTALAGAIPRAFREQARVAYKGLRVSGPGGDQMLTVTVRPVHGRPAGATHVLVQLDECGAVPPPKELPQELDLGQAAKERFSVLEDELRRTKENLQATIEEMETGNEELQATNQELTAANEELQSTNEELHSVNEELYTVNAEYQKKIAELTELSADMDNLLASTEVHTVFLDRDLRVRKFTPKIAEAFNLLPHDAGRPIDHFTHTIDHPGLLDDVRAVLDRPTLIERQVRDRRGNWFLLRVLPYRAGLAVDGAVLTLIDLTRVKQVEAEARRKDEQLAGILRHSPNWVYIKDLAGRYLVTDESFRRAIGQNPLGRTAHDIFPRELADALTAGDSQVASTGREYQGEVVIPLTDGARTFLTAKFPVRDEAERIVGVGGIKTDVTAIRAAEQTAREAVTQRDRFLAMLSHELRNPLAAVLSAADVAGRLAPGSPEVREWLRVIGRRARHMARLVDDLLDVARFTQNKVEVRTTTVDLAATVRDVLEEVRSRIEEAGLTLSTEAPGRPLRVDGDPDRLQQVQVNLLMNAAKYTPAGGQVWYIVRQEDGQAVIRVRDTGVGLSVGTLAKVFEPFVQADETLDRAGGGIGLGLTLVRSIVEIHGGTVEAHSDGPGRGSEFVVRLPLSLRGETPATGGPSPTTVSTGLRILVVEDDPDIRASLAGLLELDGHGVTAVADGPSALAALDVGRFDAGLLDIGLPGMDGYSLAQAIHVRPDRPPCLIALTGYGRSEDRTAAGKTGFDGHLTKPFRPDDLNRLLSGLSAAAVQRQ